MVNKYFCVRMGDGMMRCSNCGTKLRKTDRFCPVCGLSRTPAENDTAYPGSGAGSGKKQNKKPDGQTGSRSVREPLYDEHLYRDSFMEEKREERTQALLITLAVLLLIALMAAGFMMLYFVVRSHRGAVGGSGSPRTEDGQVPGGSQDGRTDWSQSVGGPSDNPDDAEVIPVGEDETDTASSGPAAGQDVPETDLPDENAGASEDDSGDPETEADTEEEEIGTEAESAVGEADRAGKIDFDEISRIVNETSDASAYGVSIYDLKQKKAYLAGAGNEPMYASAVITVPILYTAAVLLEQGDISRDDPVTYVNSVGGRGEANPEDRDGEDYPLSYYLETMLSYSDNNCINVLIDYLGLDRINDVCHNAGFKSVDLQRKIVAVVTDGTENYVSAADLGGMVLDLYNNKYPGIGRKYLEEHFRVDPGEDGNTVIGLAEGVSGADLFLNQNGMGESRFAEVALVSDENHAYIISEMMMGRSGFGYIDTGIEISAYVYGALGE